MMLGAVWSQTPGAVAKWFKGISDKRVYWHLVAHLHLREREVLAKQKLLSFTLCSFTKKYFTGMNPSSPFLLRHAFLTF